MGFFDNVLNAVGKAVNVVMYGAGTLVGITAAGAVEFSQVAIEKYKEFRAKNRSVNLTLENKKIHHLNKEINDEIYEYELKRRRDGRLNENDKILIDELYTRRESLKSKYRKNKELLLTEDIQEEEGSYGSINIQNSNTHILQFHVGQTVFGKKCRQCGRPMVLQWKQGMKTVSMNDFFWGCIGFYEGLRHNEPFRTADMDLFTKITRPEFELTAGELGGIIHMPGPKNNIISRLSKAKAEQSETHLCPIHNEPMVLREKKEAQGLLDQYFFGCVRWKPNREGCSQIVKLKSPGQLASALESYYGRGIL